LSDQVLVSVAVRPRSFSPSSSALHPGTSASASNALQIADIERILGAAVTGMLALELAVRLLLGLGLFQRDDLRLGQHQALWPA
jgi:hypothetical protein